MSELPLLVFDVNETLLDIEALAPHFQRIYGDAGVLREWFAQLILYSEAITLTGNYVPFGELAGAVAQQALLRGETQLHDNRSIQLGRLSTRRARTLRWISDEPP